jgi:hypothetical protein
VFYGVLLRAEMAQKVLRHVAVKLAKLALEGKVLDNFLDIIQHQLFCQEWILTAFDVMVMGEEVFSKKKVGNFDVANFTRGVFLVWSRDLVHQLHFPCFDVFLQVEGTSFVNCIYFYLIFALQKTLYG